MIAENGKLIVFLPIWGGRMRYDPTKLDLYLFGRHSANNLGLSSNLEHPGSKRLYHEGSPIILSQTYDDTGKWEKIGP